MSPFVLIVFITNDSLVISLETLTNLLSNMLVCVLDNLLSLIPTKILFKFGVISFSDGYQDLNSFIISGEALKGLDGTSFECSIN